MVQEDWPIIKLALNVIESYELGVLSLFWRLHTTKMIFKRMFSSHFHKRIFVSILTFPTSKVAKMSFNLRKFHFLQIHMQTVQTSNILSVSLSHYFLSSCEPLRPDFLWILHDNNSFFLRLFACLVFIFKVKLNEPMVRECWKNSLLSLHISIQCLISVLIQH